MMTKTFYRSIDELEEPGSAGILPAGVHASSVHAAAGSRRTGRLEGGGPFADDVDRRDFLKLAGFSLAAVAATSCQRPLAEKAIPYLMAPEQIVPGRSYYLASTCHGCAARCGILVKCRDGRPIKIEGNPDHPLSRGGVCATGQAMVLGVYDSMRLRGPMLDGKEARWSDVDAFIAAKLGAAKRVRVLTTTIPSPAADRAIAAFLGRFEDGRRIVYDTPSCSAVADAHEATHGVRLVPHYRFDKADTIVSFDADFLGTWISPVEFTKQWSSRRDATSAMSWHAQIESRMSLTGSNADQRLRIDPRDAGAILAHLVAATGASVGDLPPLPIPRVVFDRIVGRLAASKGRSLVVSGSSRTEDQILVNAVNNQLGNYGATIDIDAPSMQRQGSDRDLANLLAELDTIDALFVLGSNPVYDLPDGDSIAKQLARVPLVVTFASHIDETSKHAHVVSPDHHPLESWSDSEPVAGVYAVTQPAIAPLRNTRAVIESFAIWSGTPASAYDLIRAQFTGDWDKTLNDGWRVADAAARKGSWRNLELPSPTPRAATDKLSLVLYPTIAMLDGRHAHNAWLHELPDPITKLTWDNCALLSPATAKKLGVKDGDVVRVACGPSCAPSCGAGFPTRASVPIGTSVANEESAGTRAGKPAPHGGVAGARAGKPAPRGGVAGALAGEQAPHESVELPAFVQPGQHDSVVAIAIGYGRAGTDRFAKIGPKWLLGRTYLAPGEPVGKRVVQLANAQSIAISKTGRTVSLASTQLHSSMEGRAPVEEIALARLTGEQSRESDDNGLWPVKAKGAHQWAMAIDLTRCTGCSGCVIACQAENNVPVVGRDEVVREREMHWIRIDRYYEGSGDEVSVVHQPVMCQHCGNAPCESVCPVLATVHSTDGLNQQVYNRCVGTRYCANNCPYKARRFNWFDYPHEDRFANLVLNPDVAVRSRGVMEKCSMCAQRIEEARIEAKVRGTAIADGAIRMACEQSCPADAIVFGDLADPKSRIASVRRDRRHYRLLEELNVQPAVGYLKLVRNA